MPAVRTLPRDSQLAPIQGESSIGNARAPSIGGIPLFLAAIALLLSPFTSNPGLTAAAVASLALLTRLLWRPGLPPAVYFICCMQWLQGALKVLHADLLGVEVWTLTMARHVEDAIYLTLAWVSAIGLGAFLALRRIDPSQLPSVLESSISAPRLLTLYAGWSLAVAVLKSVSLASFAQAIGALATLRWAVVFVIFAWGWSGRRERVVALGVLLLETALGFLSFFSEFKTPLYLFAIAILTVGRRPTARQYFVFAVVFSVTLYLGVLWSAIKMDYRDRLSGGRGHQTQQVVLSTEERLEQFLELVGTVDLEILRNGAEQLVDRIAYVEYFAYVIDYVPALHDHEGGRLWLRAIEHVLTPRMFFPGKDKLESDTAVAERYTGLQLGAGSGTSITIGLPAETYVDVGSPGMFVIAVLLGLLYGSGFRFLVTQGRGAALSHGFAVALYTSMASVGSAASKVLGGYLSAFIIAAIVWRIAGPALTQFLSADRDTRS